MWINQIVSLIFAKVIEIKEKKKIENVHMKCKYSFKRDKILSKTETLRFWWLLTRKSMICILIQILRISCNNCSKILYIVQIWKLWNYSLYALGAFFICINCEKLLKYLSTVFWLIDNLKHIIYLYIDFVYY